MRSVTYYGEDNGIDGIVLEVLIRRHNKIRASTGVSVPVPVDSTTVMKAIWESLLLRGKDTEQLTLDFADATNASLAEQVQVQWVNIAEREKASRSRFRQAGLQPNAIAPILESVRRSLGGPADAERFTREALALLNAQIADTADGFTARIDTVPLALRDQLLPIKDHRLNFHQSFPVPDGHHVLTRTDPAVEAVARYVLDTALDPTMDANHRPARRAAVIRAAAVATATTLLVVRYRLEITLPGAHATITQIAEDAQFLAFTPSGEKVRWLPRESIDALLDAVPTGNVADVLARAQLERTLDRLPGLAEHLDDSGRAAATALIDDHRAVRAASHIARRGLTAKFLPPADVLGVYVLLPETSPR